ncbi:hypothetical protein [Achromobacter deleyi]|uniref:hypothetical protein n=1 Tax=Achromobacter deleyi TaxID=1353891 RepID=UPI0014931D33|nr:hypothetical protein [Achromobacter deleyi]QVQ28882.1 hypothetical protein HLG70_10980 [Achromobacter deleyi]UIP18998.1 hypothetical protein LYZ39_18565 [Achromobacter deleyi]
MKTPGLRNPKASAFLFCRLAILGGFIAAVLGIIEIYAIDHATVRAMIVIGLGSISAVLGGAFFLNLSSIRRTFRMMRDEQTAIARWVVPAEQVERYREIDQHLSSQDKMNSYGLPQTTPRDGIEVIFSDEGVLIGDHYFCLATSGLYCAMGVRFIEMDPPIIEFDIVMPAITNPSPAYVGDVFGVLRVPVAAEAEQKALQIASHFDDIFERRVIVNPDRWTKRIRISLAAAVVAFACGVAGVALISPDQGRGHANRPSLFLIIFGVLGTGGGLIASSRCRAFRKIQFHQHSCKSN